jgi:TPR repeat protein
MDNYDLMNSFCCPITQELMENPVIAMDGITYERKAIEDWLSRGNQTSPSTGAILKTKLLIENVNMRSLIKLIKERKNNIDFIFDIKSNHNHNTKIQNKMENLLSSEQTEYVEKSNNLGKKYFEKSKKQRAKGNWKEAFKNLIYSANEGYIYSYFNIYFFLEGKIGGNTMVKKNANLSAKYYELIFENLSFIMSQANEDDKDAIFILFNFYFEGIIFEKDLTLALEYGEKGAKLGCPFCMHLLALILKENGDKRCLELYNQAFQMGLLMSKNNFSYIFKEGGLLPKDLNKYKEIQEDLCENYDFNFAQFHYGCFYLDEEKNLEKAFYYLYKSAENGNLLAMEKISNFYEKGIFVKKNLPLAEMWKTKAKYL